MDQLSDNEKMPTCTVGNLRRFVSKLAPCEDDAEVTLEMLLVATFPFVFDNIKQAMLDQYTKGYIQGRNESHEN